MANIDINIVLKDHQRTHRKRFIEHFAYGLKKHGQKFTVSSENNFPECDLAVFFSHRLKNIMTVQKNAGKDFLCAEGPFVGKRNAWLSIGYNGVNNHADFLNEGKDNTRWNRYHKDKLFPYKLSGKYIIIAGQEATHSEKIKKWKKWVYETHAALTLIYDMPVCYRPHPNVNWKKPPSGIKLIKGNIISNLKGAAFVVTLNSNFAVDAVLNGVPTISMDSANMTWDITSHDVSMLVFKDRAKWTHELAWCQWSYDEMKSGDAWEHLKGKYES